MNLEEGGYHVLVAASLQEGERQNWHGLYDEVIPVARPEALWGKTFDTCTFSARAEMMPHWMETLQIAKETARRCGGKILYI